MLVQPWLQVAFLTCPFLFWDRHKLNLSIFGFSIALTGQALAGLGQDNSST